jgi:UDP-glucose 6-dehydrogenase
VLELDTINICVPTPLRKTKDPNMNFIVSSCQEIGRHFHAGMLVILESTTYPGTTRSRAPHAVEIGLEVGHDDFFLCFSPERVDPGNSKYQTSNIPKVVGGCTAACTEKGRQFYAQALEHVVPVSSTQVAEMVKLLENTIRMINIGLAKEIAMMCDRMGINLWEGRLPVCGVNHLAAAAVQNRRAVPAAGSEAERPAAQFPAHRQHIMASRRVLATSRRVSGSGMRRSEPRHPAITGIPRA